MYIFKQDSTRGAERTVKFCGKYRNIFGTISADAIMTTGKKYVFLVTKGGTILIHFSTE